MAVLLKPLWQAKVGLTSGHKKVKLYIFTQMSEQFWPQAQIDEKAENCFVQIRFFFLHFSRETSPKCVLVIFLMVLN